MKNIILLLVLVGMFKAGDAAISAWTTPAIASAASGTGTLDVAEDQALNTTITKYAATTDGTKVTYSLVTAVAPFAVASSGELTITAALDYETTPTYKLAIQAVDNAGTSGSGTATITVTVTDVNEAPAFAKTTYATTIADKSTAGTTVFTVTATDQDSGDTITYSIAAGDTGNHFAIGSSTGVITVKTGVTLNVSAMARYALQIEAADNDGSSLTGTATLNIEVTPRSGATTIVLPRSGATTIVLPRSGATTIVLSTAMILFVAFVTMQY